MRAKRIVLYALVAGAFLAAGCGQTQMDQNRQEARQRWALSRAEMVTRMAEGCFARGEYGRARQHVEEVLKDHVPHAPLYIVAARLAVEKSDLDGAHLYARTAKSLDPKSAEACYVLGTIEQTRGRSEAALAEFAQASDLAPTEARYALARTEMMIAQGQTAEAAQFLAEAADRMSGRPEVHAALGDTLAMLGRHSEAVVSYRVASRLDANLEGLKGRLATALFYAGAYAEAEPLLAAVADLEPDFAAGWALQMRADCLLALGRVPEARRLWHHSLLMRRDPVLRLVALAKCDLLEGKMPAARQCLEEALLREATHPEANALMGYVLLAQGKPGEARVHLNLALKEARLPGRAAVERLLAQATDDGT